MENITYAECKHAKWVWKDFEIKNLGKYHDLYVQSDTLFSAPGLAWQQALKKD